MAIIEFAYLSPSDVLPPDLAKIYRTHEDAVRVVSATEKLLAFRIFVRQIAGLIGDEAPRGDVSALMWGTARREGLLNDYDDAIIQTELTAGFEDPLGADGDHWNDHGWGKANADYHRDRQQRGSSGPTNIT